METFPLSHSWLKVRISIDLIGIIVDIQMLLVMLINLKWERISERKEKEWVCTLYIILDLKYLGRN